MKSFYNRDIILEHSDGNNSLLISSKLAHRAYLDVSGYELGDEDAKHISELVSESLKSNSVLTQLNLRAFYLGEEGAKRISESLKSNTTLTGLVLDGDDINKEGARHISEYLKSNSTLTQLGIQSNTIGVEGVKHISESLLKSNSTLMKLDLYLI
eukprot:TRINITY_DN6224_c0_g1_i1.p1 TRINITY_DN6224_c0_g1~~TRINITY_DN6224_c0_g1_i1.p1  ORF type:complete len:155 (+),score=29.84 TRINITY_DN6224_c0_g1_i1:66-530(+)